MDKLEIKYSLLDRVLIAIDSGIRSFLVKPIPQRQSPATNAPDNILNSSEKKQSAALMRINHAGEVCAQALYYGQAMVAKSEITKKTLLQAAAEETDHLSWCQERIHELDDHTSYLNPLWYIGAFSIGLLAGLINDQWSLGFVVETERQVEKHLQNHLTQLPYADNKSRRILQQMSEDEAEHATNALSAGAIELPEVVKLLMKGMSKIMTKTTYYL